MSSSYEPTSATAGQAMARAVRDVGRECRGDAQAGQPARQCGNRRLAARGVKHHHRARVGKTVHRQRDQASSPACLTVRPHQIVGMLIGRHRRDHGNADNGQRGRPPDDPIGRPHQAPPSTSENSADTSHGLLGAVPRTAKPPGAPDDCPCLPQRRAWTVAVGQLCSGSCAGRLDVVAGRPYG